MTFEAQETAFTDPRNIIVGKARVIWAPACWPITGDRQPEGYVLPGASGRRTGWRRMWWPWRWIASLNNWLAARQILRGKLEKTWNESNHPELTTAQSKPRSRPKA